MTFRNAERSWERYHLGPDDASDAEDDRAASLRADFEQSLIDDPTALVEGIDDDASDHLLELLELLTHDDLTVEAVMALRDVWVSRIADRRDWIDAAREFSQ